MERTLLLLFALSSLLVYPIAADPVTDYIRPHVKLGSGTVTCALVPMAGITLTVSCEDGVNPTATMTATTDKDGLFSFDYYTDYQDKQPSMNPVAAKCTLVSAQPAVISKQMTCGGIVDGSCSITLASTPLAAEMSVSYTAAPAGCTPKVDPQRNEPIPTSSIPCPKNFRQVLSTTQVVSTVQDMTIPVDAAAKSDEDTCAQACMGTPDCAHYTFNCMACALYKKGAIALNAAQLVTNNYDVTTGSFVCPTYIASCR